jgi:hypothetical protein
LLCYAGRRQIGEDVSPCRNGLHVERQPPRPAGCGRGGVLSLQPRAITASRVRPKPLVAAVTRIAAVSASCVNRIRAASFYRFSRE